MPTLAERLSSAARSPQGWAVVPSDLLHEAAQRVGAVTLADVVIPTKANHEGLARILSVLPHDPAVGRVIVVGDGDDSTPLATVKVPLGVGIHVMWNRGMALCAPNRHVLFLNDDVTVTDTTVSGMVRCLDEHPEIGLVCPNYSGAPIDGAYRSVHDTCRGRYDGSGGMAGFAMMLRSTLVPEWRFDERMKWWYGDDDIVAWVTHERRMVAAITPLSTCSDNESWTILHAPPPTFAEDVESDRIIYERKWRAWYAR